MRVDCSNFPAILLPPPSKSREETANRGRDKAEKWGTVIKGRGTVGIGKLGHGKAGARGAVWQGAADRFRRPLGSIPGSFSVLRFEF